MLFQSMRFRDLPMDVEESRTMNRIVGFILIMMFVVVPIFIWLAIRFG